MTAITPAERIISLRDVSMTRGDRQVLSGINLDVYRGDFLAITGPNGGGKTTLLRIILRLLKPTQGTVRYFSGGCVAKHLSTGYLPQKNSIDSRFPITVRQVVESGLVSGAGRELPDHRAKVDEMLADIGLSHKADSPIGALSGGQLQRTLLGRALVAPHELIVLDEPLSYIDREFEQRMYEIIARRAESATVLLVSHEMTQFARMANRHVIIDHTLSECRSHSHNVHYDCEV